MFHFTALLWESIILLLPPPPAKPTLLQYYCTTIEQYTRPPPTPPFYAIHHTILVMALSCKGQCTHRNHRRRRVRTARVLGVVGAQQRLAEHQRVDVRVGPLEPLEGEREVRLRQRMSELLLLLPLVHGFPLSLIRSFTNRSSAWPIRWDLRQRGRAARGTDR